MPGAFGVGLYLPFSCLCRFLFSLWFWRRVGAFVTFYMVLFMYLFTFPSTYISYLEVSNDHSKPDFEMVFSLSYCCIVENK